MQFKRMRRALKKLKGYTGRVMRDLRRHLSGIPAGALRDKICDALVLTGRLLAQKLQDKNKIYNLHESEVDCIYKGKARVRCEFGTKVSIAATIDGGLIVGARSMPGNPYDWHTLNDALDQVEVLTDLRPSLAVVDRGYRGRGVARTRVLISGMRKGIM
jgi:transposase, IS5 family